MTVSKNKIDGTWHFSVYVNNSAGNKIRKRGYGYATKKEAQAKEDEIVKQYEVFSLAKNGSGDITLKNLYDLYISSSCNSLSTNSKKIYYFCYRKLVDFFGEDKKCFDIDVNNAQQYRISLENTLGTKRSVNIYANFAKAIFNFGLEYGYLATNPFASRLIKSSNTLDNPTKNVWSIEDTNLFLSTLNKQNAVEYRLYMFVKLLFNTGLRPSEALSLTWDKVQGNNIYVDRQAVRNGKTVEFTPLKTKSSKRVVYISDQIVAELNQYKNVIRATNRAFSEQWFVFHKGTPYSINNIGYLFVKKQKGLGLPSVTLHGLRHSHASVLLKNGVDVAYISKRLGHSNISITLNTYSHYIESKDNQDNLKMASIMSM